MAKVTPEGKVKKRLIAKLKELGQFCYYYMPVQNGMGQTGVPDIMATIQGLTFAFECKATPKQQPTSLQAMALQAIDLAGGMAFVVDNESIDVVEDLIEQMKAEIESSSSLDYSFSDVISLKNEEAVQPLFRWRDKLEPMAFANGG